MNIILFDAEQREHLLPITYTRPVASIRVGILTIKEKWEKFLNTKASFLTIDYLQEKFPIQIEKDNILINGGLFPDSFIIEEINQLKEKEALTKDNQILAIRLDEKNIIDFLSGNLEDYTNKECDLEVELLNRTWEIFSKNGEQIAEDYDLITKDRKSQTISNTVQIIGDYPVFLEEGAQIECAIINTKEGPVYIGKDAEIMEAAVIRGPFALCEHSTVKMAAKIYGDTTIGPHCKVGGELNNVVFQAYSNKAHDGFLGNAVIGEWCNLGADTNNSNLKNNYVEVAIWDYPKGGFVKTGLQFCGLIMGDHSKCGINTMFNTGTVVGVSANIFGSGFPRNFIPSFSWGGASGFKEYKTNKAYEVAEKVFARRNLVFDEVEKKILDSIFELSQNYRKA
jgi:UDP-N-acetylglucosamine diphosphorylase/glucosamine-1-phosphate N-acetyltransferase